MLSAAILVGGQSRRLGGRDKSALVVDGRLILDRQITELSAVADEILMVGGCATHARPARARAVADRIPGCGPLGGLHAALTEAASDVIVVVACDMPYVSAPLLAHMLRLAGNADAVVPQTDRGYHPLCAVYTRGCAAAVGRHVTERRLKLTELLAALRVRVVTAREIGAFGDADQLLANVNTPAEFASLETLRNHEV
jgi:molybdopterin-guanine dinucleotide biosynthesis protein A